MVAICTSLNFDFRMTLPLLGAMHYTDCPLFSPLRLRVDREQSSQLSAWGRYGVHILIGVAATVVGELILAFILGTSQSANFYSNREETA